MKAFVYDPMCAFHVVVRCGWLMPMTRGYDTLVHDTTIVEAVNRILLLKTFISLAYGLHKYATISTAIHASIHNLLSLLLSFLLFITVTILPPTPTNSPWAPFLNDDVEKLRTLLKFTRGCSPQSYIPFPNLSYSFGDILWWLSNDTCIIDLCFEITINYIFNNLWEICLSWLVLSPTPLPR